MAHDKLTQLDKVKLTLVYIDQCLLPALQSYVSAVQDLQMIFQQFHTDAKGLQKNMEKTNEKIKVRADRHLQILHQGMLKKAKKIGDTCNVTVNLYNDIKCQLEAIRQLNNLDDRDEQIQSMARKISGIVEKEARVLVDDLPQIVARLKSDWWSHMIAKNNYITYGEDSFFR